MATKVQWKFEPDERNRWVLYAWKADRMPTLVEVVNALRGDPMFESSLWVYAVQAYDEWQDEGEGRVMTLYQWGFGDEPCPVCGRVKDFARDTCPVCGKPWQEE